jgi:hypothetical protein
VNPEGHDEPGGDIAAIKEPKQSIIPEESNTPVSGNSESGHYKPVGFVNNGTVAALVMAWTYVPLDSSTPAIPSDASTISFPPNVPGLWPNSSRFLSLPLGTYTWCYSWELGDLNNDEMTEYAHVIDERPVVLDEMDSDDPNMGQQVDISIPPDTGVLPGRCMIEDQLIQTVPVGSGPMAINIYSGDASSFGNRPELIVYANGELYPPPEGFSLKFSPDSTSWYHWRNLENSSQWFELGVTRQVTSIGVQFFADTTQGWAGLVLDGSEVWRGDTLSCFDGTNWACYVEITGISQGPHTLRVENLGIPGSGGGQVVAIYFFGFRLR